MTQSWINNDKDERITIEFDDTTRAWNDWKHGNIIQKPSVRDRYIVSLVECTKMYMTYNGLLENPDRSGSHEIPSLVKTAPQIDINCHICRKYQGPLYACRICGKVYHQQCIKDIGDRKSYYLIKNATNLIGWTCPICEDLCVLLSPVELAETNEWIKSLAIQSNFNLDNYINSRMKFKSSISFDFNELKDRIKISLQIFLNTIADLTSNRLSQGDLFTLDVNMKILCTPSNFLVNSLTPFELYRISQLFISLSSVDNQCITYNEFQQFFSNYLLTTMPELNSDEKNSHLEALAYSILGNTGKFDRTWPQFVLDATIPTLFGRYNHRAPFDFINRIVSTNRSISPRTANIMKYTDDQSLAILINNILQKLKQTVENETNPVEDQYKSKYSKMKKRINKKIGR